MKNLILLIVLFFPMLVFPQDNPELIPFKEGNLWGFAANDGTLKIKAQYDKVEFFGGGMAKVWKNRKQGFIDSEGEDLVELIYEKTNPIYFGNQLFSAKKGERWGVINSDKKILLNFNFDKIEMYSNPFLRVKQNSFFGLYKLIDEKLVEYLPLKYTDIEINEYSENYFFKGVVQNGDIEYLDKTGKLIKKISQENKDSQKSYEIETDIVMGSPPSANNNKYPQFQPFKSNGESGMIIQRKSNNINTYGQILTDTLIGEFQEIITEHSFSDAYVVKQNGKWGAINVKGQVIIKSEYDSIDVKSMRFQGREGQTFVVQKNGKWGVIGNKNKFRQVGAPNEVRIPFQYDSIRRNVNNTYYIVALDEKFGVVNSKNFELIIEPLYHQIKDTFRRINNFAIFSITLENGEEVYVGENGVQFFSN